MFTFLGVLPSTYFAHNYSMALGTTIEMVVFSLALANQINWLKKENEAKQLQLIENLREKEQMQSRMNKELEIKVEERTREIQQQKEKIEDQKEAIEIEMKKNEELLLNILPESTAKELILNGRAVPKSYDQVTILFADFQNFTAIAESLTPEKLVDNLDQYFRAFDNAIAAFPIEKIKTIGDAYMCAGGLPEENTTNARDIALAALKMMEEVDRINQQKVAAGEQPWNLRIGINTGPVTAGVVGKSKFAYDLWGDTVNIASRMETNSEAGKINVSESTHELIKDQFVFSYRGQIAAKNKGELAMYFLEGQSNDAGSASEKV
jgi:class 3 adenylate cyclase